MDTYKPKTSIPYYFIAIHNEPYHSLPVQYEMIRDSYHILKQMIAKANDYHIKLTLMFTAQWADYVSVSSEKMADLESWKNRAHEIAAHHHGIYVPGNWDGYTDYLEEAIIQRTSLRKEPKSYLGVPEKYLGTLKDFINKLKKINPNINSGCLNDEYDKNQLPDEIIHDTCGGFASFGEPGKMRPMKEGERGINEFITVGTYKNIERKWLAHYLINTYERQEAARRIFNSMNPGVFGVIAHSTRNDADQYYSFLEFLHSMDPSGEKSKTLTEIIDQKLLPEKRIPEEVIMLKSGRPR